MLVEQSVPLLIIVAQAAHIGKRQAAFLVGSGISAA